MKKIFGILLIGVLAMALTGISAFAVGAKYYITIDTNVGGMWLPADPNYQMKPIETGSVIYSLTKSLPASTYKDGSLHFYKVTDGTWNNCWGLDTYTKVPLPSDPSNMGDVNIPGTKAMTVTFYFNSQTHAIADSTYYTMLSPYIVGSFFSEMGIGSDWDASKATMLLSDPGFVNTYTGTYKLPAGSYSFIVTMGKSSAKSYGANGSTAGKSAGIKLNLTSASQVAFTFNGKTHLTTVSINGTGASTVSSSQTVSSSSAQASASSQSSAASGVSSQTSTAGASISSAGSSALSSASQASGSISSSSQASSGAGGGAKNRFLIPLIIAAVVLICAGAATFFIVKRRIK